MIGSATYRYLDDQLSSITRVRWQCWTYAFLNGMKLRFDFKERLRFNLEPPEYDIPGIEEEDVIAFVREYERRRWLEKERCFD